MRRRTSRATVSACGRAWPVLWLSGSSAPRTKSRSSASPLAACAAASLRTASHSRGNLSVSSVMEGSVRSQSRISAFRGLAATAPTSYSHPAPGIGAPTISYLG